MQVTSGGQVLDREVFAIVSLVTVAVKIWRAAEEGRWDAEEDGSPANPTLAAARVPEISNMYHQDQGSSKSLHKGREPRRTPWLKSEGPKRSDWYRKGQGADQPHGGKQRRDALAGEQHTTARTSGSCFFDQRGLG